MTITTNFVGTEETGTVMSRLESILDHYYGAGYFDTLTTRGNIRSAANAMLAVDFLADTELASSFIAKLNRLNDPDLMRDELATLVQANRGGFWDLTDSTTVFESVNNSDPCEPGDLLRFLLARSQGTITDATWSQAIGTSRPTWQTTYADFDGGDLLEADTNTLTILQNASAAILCAKCRISSLSVTQQIMGWSTNATDSSRLSVQITTGGELSVLIRRLDGDSLTTITSSGLALTTGVDYTITVTVDFAGGGAGAVRGYVNGVTDVLNGTLSGSGATSNTASGRARLGANLSLTPVYSTSRIYRVVALAMASVPTEGQRALITGVVGGA